MTEIAVAKLKLQPRFSGLVARRYTDTTLFFNLYCMNHYINRISTMCTELIFKLELEKNIFNIRTNSANINTNSADLDLKSTH